MWTEPLPRLETMTTYDKVKTEVLALPVSQQDGLLNVLAAEHVKRQAGEKAASATGWKQKVWQAVAVIATLVASVLGVLTCTGCTTAVKKSQTATDGSVTTTERVFSLSAADARDLIKLYGELQIPVVNVGK